MTEAKRSFGVRKSNGFGTYMQVSEQAERKSGDITTVVYTYKLAHNAAVRRSLERVFHMTQPDSCSNRMNIYSVCDERDLLITCSLFIAPIVVNAPSCSQRQTFLSSPKIARITEPIAQIVARSHASVIPL